MSEYIAGSIEDKKAQLIEAGYIVGTFRDFVATPDNTPELLRIEWAGSLTHPHALCVEKAYAHLTEKKRLAGLEDFVKEILSTTEKSLFKAKGANPDLINSQVLAIAISFDYEDIERMKRLANNLPE